MGRSNISTSFPGQTDLVCTDVSLHGQSPNVKIDRKMRTSGEGIGPISIC